MSGFDNMMQTDALISQDRRNADALVTRSNLEAGRAFGQLNQMPQIMMAREKLDSDIRMQEIAAESQMHQNKLNTMMMMDQVDMSRIGVEQAQLDLRRRQQEFDEYERNRTDSLEQRRRDRRAKMLPYLQKQGQTYDPNTGQVRDMTAEEKQLFNSGRGGSQNPYSEPRLTAQYIIDKGSIGGVFDPANLTDQERLWLRQAEAGMYGQQIQSQVQGPGVDPGAALEDQGYAPQPAAQPQQEQRPIPQQIQYHGAMAAGELDPVMLESLPQETRTKLMVGLGAVAERLGQMGSISPEMAGRYVGGQFMGNDNLDLVAEVLTMADFSDAQIRAYLSTRLIDSEDPESAINAIMDRRDDYGSRVLKERGEGTAPATGMPPAPQQLPPGFDFGQFFGGGDLFGGGR